MIKNIFFMCVFVLAGCFEASVPGAPAPVANTNPAARPSVDNPPVENPDPVAPQKGITGKQVAMVAVPVGGVVGVGIVGHFMGWWKGIYEKIKGKPEAKPRRGIPEANLRRDIPEANPLRDMLLRGNTIETTCVYFYTEGTVSANKDAIKTQFGINSIAEIIDLTQAIPGSCGHFYLFFNHAMGATGDNISTIKGILAVLNGREQEDDFKNKANVVLVRLKNSNKPDLPLGEKAQLGLPLWDLILDPKNPAQITLVHYSIK